MYPVSNFPCQVLSVLCHIPYVRSHVSGGRHQASHIWNPMSCVQCHESYIRCPMSGIPCQMFCVRHPMSSVLGKASYANCSKHSTVEHRLIHPNKCTKNINCTSLSFGHHVISFSTTAINLGFHLTDDMSCDAHVQDICRKAYIDMRRISSSCYLLSDATKTLLGAFVLPKLDYGNSLFYGSPMYLLEGLHMVQNSVARVTSQCCRQNHISPLIMTLHWLPSYLSLSLFTIVSYLLV